MHDLRRTDATCELCDPAEYSDSSLLILQAGSDAPVQIWSMPELGLAIVSACLPTMRPLFVQLFGKPESEPECAMPEMRQQELDPDPNLQPFRSMSMRSLQLAHLGVLEDFDIDPATQVETGHKMMHVERDNYDVKDEMGIVNAPANLHLAS